MLILGEMSWNPFLNNLNSAYIRSCPVANESKQMYLNCSSPRFGPVLCYLFSGEWLKNSRSLQRCQDKNTRFTHSVSSFHRYLSTTKSRGGVGTVKIYRDIILILWHWANRTLICFWQTPWQLVSMCLGLTSWWRSQVPISHGKVKNIRRFWNQLDFNPYSSTYPLFSSVLYG